MIAQALRRLRDGFYKAAVADLDFAHVEARTIPTSGRPCRVTDVLGPLPGGWYRLRNGERVRVEALGDELVRAFGCSLPSALPLRWAGNGRYAPAGTDHPLDLVEYEGDAG